MVGRQIGSGDPDSGTISDQLDANGNVLQETDARGQTIYADYDGLNRQLWRNTTNSPTGAYVTYTYDGTVPSGISCTGITPGSNAIGHTTTEQFTSGPNNSFSGSYCASYDARGEPIGQVDTLAGTTYAPVLLSYNDAGVMTQRTYPTGEYEQANFSPQGWLISITRYAQSTQSYLIPSITYNNPAGAAGLPDGYVIGGTGFCSAANSSIICASLSYDGDLRLTQATYTHPTSTTPITYYSLGVTYDAVGNVTSVSSALPAAGSQSGGQDNQQFCYDELNQLTWAGTTSTNPCTGQEVMGTTLTSASYTASYQYDGSSRITQSTLTGALASAPQGSYSYDSTHVHAVVGIGGSNGYTAQYDAAGNMVCRAPTGSQVCTGTTQTGARLTYDVEGRLIQWVSADGSTTVNYGYDGEGNRFEQQVISGGTTTTTYIGNLQENQTVGGITITTTYYNFNGQRVAEDQNGHWYYLINDGLTSTTVVVDSTGVVAAQLFGPYGQVRWAGGTMPTSYAFTGQRTDASTGLDYYSARYYDPAAGRFTSADTFLQGGGYDPSGLNAYAYVENNPETYTDPTGYRRDPPPQTIWQAIKKQMRDAGFLANLIGAILGFMQPVPNPGEQYGNNSKGSGNTEQGVESSGEQNQSGQGGGFTPPPLPGLENVIITFAPSQPTPTEPTPTEPTPTEPPSNSYIPWQYGNIEQRLNAQREPKIPWQYTNLGQRQQAQQHRGMVEVPGNPNAPSQCDAWCWAGRVIDRIGEITGLKPPDFSKPPSLPNPWALPGWAPPGEAPPVEIPPVEVPPVLVP